MTGPEPTEPTLADVLAAIEALGARVAVLEQRLQSAEVPEDVVVAISAAVAAFLGHRAKVKQVHFRTGEAYAQLGRAVVQGRHNVYGSR